MAASAIGLVVGANPVALMIPCHRLIQQNGKLGGYHWGETRKQAIHAWEAARYEWRGYSPDSGSDEYRLDLVYLSKAAFTLEATRAVRMYRTAYRERSKRGHVVVN